MKVLIFFRHPKFCKGFQFEFLVDLNNSSHLDLVQWIKSFYDDISNVLTVFPQQKKHFLFLQTLISIPKTNF